MKKIIVFVLFILFVVCVTSVGAVMYFMQPANSSQQEKMKIVIPKGKSVSWIGQQLEEKKIIRSKYAFRFFVLKEQIGTKLQAGTFELSPSQSLSEVAYALTKGTDDVWVTILEGWRNEEVAAELEKTFGSDVFRASTFISLAKDSEGYLFPDTYLLPKTLTEASALNYLKKITDEKITAEMRKKIEARGLTIKQVLTMASLIEREARGTKDMKIVSGILWKRVDAGWPLQVDATLQYVKGYNMQEKSWWTPPLAADKQLNSLYNTYKHQGLPPGPICNPGIEAINAAINPTESEYWYYITDDAGNMHYAKTVEEHNANVNTYLR